VEVWSFFYGLFIGNVKGGGGKGVNRVFWKCFFHCGEGRGLDFFTN